MSKKFLNELALVDDPKEFLRKIAFSTREEIWDVTNSLVDEGN